jgi:hypothetical protein
VCRTIYEALDEETPLKSYNFGTATLERRRRAGERDLAAQLALLTSLDCNAAGLTIYRCARGTASPV